MNIVAIKGNLAKDPYVGKSGMVGITVAVNEYVSKGEKNVVFIDCIAFKKVAENIAKFFKKGKPVVIWGRLVESTKTKGKLIVIVNGFDFIDSLKTDNDDTKDDTDDDNDFPF